MPHYRAFLGASLTQLVVIGFLFGFGVLFKEFEREYGWSRTLLSSCSAIAFFVMGVLALFTGRLSDKYGPRLILAISGLGYGFGFVLMSQVTQSWQILVIFATFIGLGMGTHDVVTLSTVARWFDKQRGFVTGLTKVGTAIGQMMIPPIIAYLVIIYGLQKSLILMGMSASILLLSAALLMSHPPKTGITDVTELKHISKSSARNSVTFKKLCGIQFLFFPTLMTIPLHITVHGIDLGMTFGQASFLLTTIGATSIAGRLVVGYFLDLVGYRNAYLISFTPILLCLFGLLFFTNHSLIFFLMAIYGVGHGGLFAVVSPTVAGYFGMEEHGALFGTILFFGTIGGAMGPILTGYAFDQFGNYYVGFTVLALFIAIGIALALTLPKCRAAVS